MANLVIPRESIEGGDAVPAGLYNLRLDDFKPKPSKAKDSVNLNPILKIVGTGNPDIDEKRIFFNMNTNFGPGLTDLVHAAGLEMARVGDDYAIPGRFDGPDDDPTKWVYGAKDGFSLKGKVLHAELVETPSLTEDGKPRVDAKGNVKMRNEIKVFFCVVPGCEVIHSKSLSK